MPQVPAEFLSEPLATTRQVAYICDLLDQKDLFADPRWFDRVNAMDADEYAAYLGRVKEEAKTWTKVKASATIEWLLKLPRKSREQAEANRSGALADADLFAAIPDGRYALVNEDDELNPVRFYRVNRGKDYRARGGRDWTNFLFVTRFSSDEEWPVKGKERIAVLKEIAFDPKTAAVRFGREINRCCICGKQLTRALSREIGIGPVCGGRNGWINAEVLAAARARLEAQGIDPDAEVA